MSFTDTQLRQLKAPVKIQFVKEREIDGKTIHYLEGWHVIDEANRIFGFDGWDRETISSQCVWQKQSTAHLFCAAYVTRVRISVRAGERIIQREGLGSGESFASTPGQAHEWASKIAETDATKRALSTFGNPFGLSLYRDKTEAPKAKRQKADPTKTSAPVGQAADQSELNRDGGPTLHRASVQTVMNPAARAASPAIGGKVHFENQSDTEGQSASLSSSRLAPMAETSLAVWVPRSHTQPPTVSGAIQCTAPEQEAPLDATNQNPRTHTSRIDPAPLRIEKSALALPEPRRIRSREHLKFVASQPCLVCARTPSQAHHLRFAQPRALGRKVSDEFTVPLCATHHHELHMRGNEREWWQDKGIEPLKVAEELWTDTRRG